MANAEHVPRRTDVDTLHGLVDTAARIVRALNADPLVDRLLRAFAILPAGDREIVLGVLEREGRSRVMASATAEIYTGLALRPNPNARLYTRVVEQEPSVETDKIMVASIRAMTLVHEVVVPIWDRWRAACREALLGLDPAARASVAEFNREMLRLIDEVETDGA